MTNQELQELSKHVAEKFKIDAFHYRDRVMDANEKDWLHQDLESVMRLAIEHGLSIYFIKKFKEDKHTRVVIKSYVNLIDETFEDHDTREQAVIVAVLKALLEVEV